ncbi:MAG: DUF3793 family protein [Hespellia sp.]|jgi:hypothetical protein|nr:DUF3793 family protein [Hespellia sp.]
MPAELLLYYCSNENQKIRLQFQIVLQCAPLLKGMKAAAVLKIARESRRYLKELFSETDILYRVLYDNREICLVFFYRENDLHQYLNQVGIRRFLKEYGYNEMECGNVLTRLGGRIQKFLEQNTEFPHEIGALLGYPLEDVREFIRHNGKKCILSGYWKVYQNPGRASMIFRAYDRAKVCAVNEFLVGRSLSEIAKKGV